MAIRSKTFIESYQEDISLFRTIWVKFWLAVLFIAILLFPLIGDRYILYIITLSGISMIGSIGLNILTGYTGQISIGHSAFIAIGAYTTTIVGKWFGLSFLILIPLSGLISCLIGMIIGIPCLRLRGLYLAMATMAFGIIVEYILFHWHSLTNGPMGMPAPPLSIMGFKFDSHIRFYYFVVLVVMILAICAKNLMRMKIGRAFVAIRDRDLAASIIGVNLTYYKVLAFGISSFYAGICGSLLAYYITHINPEYFTLFLSIEYIAMIIVGGLGSILGSILGALFINLIPEGLRLLFGIIGKSYHLGGFEFTDQMRVAIYGLSIILFLIFESGGLFAIWQRIKNIFKTWPFTYR
jgi:branched-chain amino acid transport system permease protein